MAKWDYAYDRFHPIDDDEYLVHHDCMVCTDCKAWDFPAAFYYERSTLKCKIGDTLQDALPVIESRPVTITLNVVKENGIVLISNTLTAATFEYDEMLPEYIIFRSTITGTTGCYVDKRALPEYKLDLIEGELSSMPQYVFRAGEVVD